MKISDVWQAMMYYAYSSYFAVINVVCIASSVALLVKLWPTSPGWFRGFLLLFLMLFTVIQPLAILARARASLHGVRPELELLFDADGLTIRTDGKEEHLPWEKITGMVQKPTIVVVYVSGGNGYILRNSVLGETKKAFTAFVREKIAANRQQ
ncbi:MAG: YcxB family protein [Lachnospiraceae bacterium]|nr:YcxB family protein [Lachnospiraceae bacterium]